MLLIAVVRLYQAVLRPIFGGQCRFFPSCSEYAVESLRRHGALRGSWLTVRRLCRCHPWGGAGYDPVPETHKHDRSAVPGSGSVSR